jgi:hypothetical protein
LLIEEHPEEKGKTIGGQQPIRLLGLGEVELVGSSHGGNGTNNRFCVS